MKNILALSMVVLLAASAWKAAAQEAAVATGGGMAEDLPPTLGAGESSGGGAASGTAGGQLEPVPEGESGAEGSFGPAYNEPMGMLEGCSSLFESSGTWLQRGYWFGAFEYLLLNRNWEAKGLTLMTESRPATSAGVPVVDTQLHAFLPFFVVNPLTIAGKEPGGEGAGRVTFGRFLFRDEDNRDHVLALSWLGGAKFSQVSSLTAVNQTNGLVVSDLVARVDTTDIASGSRPTAFQGAQSSQFDYNSELNTVEANYEVKTRMHRDQMVLEPNGDWVRQATPTKTFSFLMGLRYLRVEEALEWRAFGINVAPAGGAEDRESGYYFVRNTNDMIGSQIGLGIGYDTARWSIGADVRGGGYWNSMGLNSRFNVGTTNMTNFGVTRSFQDNLSFVGQFELTGRWHMRPNLSLVAGMNLLYVEGIALAPHQLNFIPRGYAPIAHADDAVYDGTSLGIEWYH